MGVESFNYRKPAVSTAPNVQLVSEMWGSRVDATQRANAPGDNIAPAGLFSTAPYTGGPPQRERKPDIRRVSDNARVVNGKPRCKANEDTCMGIAYNGEYCLGHRKHNEKQAREQVPPSTSRD